MHWEPCENCEKRIIIFDLKKTPTGWRCDSGCEAPKVTTKIQHVDPPHPLIQEFGFSKPEDGSAERYAAHPPWMKFRFWWFVHNAIAHPLIAIIPRRMFFRFHDYTSRKMHGR